MVGEGLLPHAAGPGPGPDVQDQTWDRRDPGVPSLPAGLGPPGCRMLGAVAGTCGGSGAWAVPCSMMRQRASAPAAPRQLARGDVIPQKSCSGGISGRGEGHAAEPPPSLPLSIPAIDCLNSSLVITM